jgi:hypothetical protein
MVRMGQETQGGQALTARLVMNPPGRWFRGLALLALWGLAVLAGAAPAGAQPAGLAPGWDWQEIASGYMGWSHMNNNGDVIYLMNKPLRYIVWVSLRSSLPAIR